MRETILIILGWSPEAYVTINFYANVGVLFDTGIIIEKDEDGMQGILRYN